MHGNTRLLFDRYAKEYFRPGLHVLEVGPDYPSTLQAMASVPDSHWHTVDLADAGGRGPTHRARDEYTFPIADETYDIVVAANVLEHVRKVWVWIKEVARVCKPGGHVILINPASWPYHEFPVDCWRAYPEGMKALYEEAGLGVLLNRCEALEDGHLRRHIPGRSLGYIYDHEGWRLKLATRVLAAIGYPVERPYDTITIGRK
ncbi:MAG TPA: methyltransferase domain-containing protein [Methylomirabilota bacterium]